MTNTTSSLRITKNDYFKAIEAMLANGVTTYTVTKGEKSAEIDVADAIEFCMGERELLERKNTNKKPTEKQTANAEIKNVILDYLNEAKEAVTISTIMKNVPACSELSNQRVAALVRQLIDDNMVVREEIKRVAYFKAVGV